jgi:hypothetical protein
MSDSKQNEIFGGCAPGVVLHYAHGFDGGNEVLRPNKAIAWSESVEIAEAWRSPTRHSGPPWRFGEKTDRVVNFDLPERRLIQANIFL